MAIDPSISLQVLHPTFDTPADALERNVRIQDIIAQTRQRNREAADHAALAPLRQLQTTNEIQKITEENLIKQSMEHAGSMVDGHFTVDPQKQSEFLAANQVPGLGSAAYLLPKAQAQNAARESDYQKQVIDHIEQQNKMLANEAGPIKNFLASKRGQSDYDALKANLVPISPAWGKALGPKFIPETHGPMFDKVDAQYEQQKTEHDKAVAAKEKRDAAKIESETREANARAVKLEQENAAPKVEAHAPGTVVITKDVNGKEISRETIPTKAEKESDSAHETRINEEAYAESIKKSVDELTSTDRLKARQWVERMSPERKTEHDKRVELATTNPKLYSFIYGHGDDDETRAMRNAILKDVLNQSEDINKDFDPDRYGQLRKIWQAQGVELPELTDIKRDEKTGSVSFGAKVSAVALPKPKAGADTATDATYQAYRKVHGTHEATLKALKADGWK